jgi:hypothetical protein
MNTWDQLKAKVRTEARQVLKDAFGAHRKQPRWGPVLRRGAARWKAALEQARNGPEVLIATGVGGHLPGTMVESALAVALTLRGARVHLLLCDEALPACLQALVTKFTDDAEFAKEGPGRRLCPTCHRPADRMFRALGLPIHRYTEHLADDEARRAAALAAETPSGAIGAFELDGLAVGEHALAGALRFYARCTLEPTPAAEAVLRRYFEASLRTAFALRRLLTSRPFTCACFHHGIYVPQGIVAEAARRQGVRVVNWNPAYRKQCFIFTHHETYHHALLTEPVENWEHIPWTGPLDAEILAYLKSRWQGTRDWIWFHEKPQEALDAITRELGIDFGKPTIGLLTNVMWDAQLHYRANAFPNMLDWVLRTIRHFAARPDLQLLIRIHPAEIRGTVPTRQPLLDEIRKAFPTLPPNVFVVPPESTVSTYAAMLQCNSVLIYGTKTGVELTSLGIPVIVAGEAWIRNKGLTMDARSPEEYLGLLDRLPLPARMSEAETRRSRQYAYHFFFRRMIPLPFLAARPGWPPFELTVQALDELEPGRSPGLDVICDGILKGTEFIYPAERLGAPGEEGAAC